MKGKEKSGRLIDGRGENWGEGRCPRLKVESMERTRAGMTYLAVVAIPAATIRRGCRRIVELLGRRAVNRGRTKIGADDVIGNETRRTLCADNGASKKKRSDGEVLRSKQGERDIRRIEKRVEGRGAKDSVLRGRHEREEMLTGTEAVLAELIVCVFRSQRELEPENSCKRIPLSMMIRWRMLQDGTYPQISRSREEQSRYHGMASSLSFIAPYSPMAYQC